LEFHAIPLPRREGLGEGEAPNVVKKCVLRHIRSLVEVIQEAPRAGPGADAPGRRGRGKTT
jgi:hypothetical protein